MATIILLFAAILAIYGYCDFCIVNNQYDNYPTEVLNCELPACQEIVTMDLLDAICLPIEKCAATMAQNCIQIKNAIVDKENSFKAKIKDSVCHEINNFKLTFYTVFVINSQLI